MKMQSIFEIYDSVESALYQKLSIPNEKVLGLDFAKLRGVCANRSERAENGGKTGFRSSGLLWWGSGNARR